MTCGAPARATQKFQKRRKWSKKSLLSNFGFILSGAPKVTFESLFRLFEIFRGLGVCSATSGSQLYVLHQQWPNLIIPKKGQIASLGEECAGSEKRVRLCSQSSAEPLGFCVRVLQQVTIVQTLQQNRRAESRSLYGSAKFWGGRPDPCCEEMLFSSQSRPLTFIKPTWAADSLWICLVCPTAKLQKGLNPENRVNV